MTDYTTQVFRERIAKMGKSYTAGYDMGGRRVNTEDATNVTTSAGAVVSFEESVDGTYTVFDLSLEQACKLVEVL